MAVPAGLNPLRLVVDRSAVIVAIYTSPESMQPTQSHERIEAIRNEGLWGDRYATGKGFYSGVVEWDAHVTLIEHEPFDQLEASQCVQISPELLRRNFVTRGVALASLIGRDFQVGESAVFHGRKVWPPCSHIVNFSGRVEIFKYLAKQTGIGADVLVGGPIRVGDPIELLS